MLTASVPAKYLEMFKNGRPDPDVLKVYRATVVVGDGTILAEFAKRAVESAPAQMPKRRRTRPSRMLPLAISDEEMAQLRAEFLPLFRLH